MERGVERLCGPVERKTPLVMDVVVLEVHKFKSGTPMQIEGYGKRTRVANETIAHVDKSEASHMPCLGEERDGRVADRVLGQVEDLKHASPSLKRGA